jgi:hypothetical protein
MRPRTFYSAMLILLILAAAIHSPTSIHSEQATPAGTGVTTRVSIATDGAQEDFYSSSVPAISADGRYVAFESYASNLVGGDTNGTRDTFVHDRGAEGSGAYSILELSITSLRR